MPASFIRRLYDYVTRHRWLSTLLLSLSSIWFLVLKLFGQDLGLVDQTSSPSSLATTISWWFICASLGIAFVKAWADQHNETLKENGQLVLDTILQSINAIKTRKLTRFLGYIESHHGQDGLDPFWDITRPEAQIEVILENLQLTLSEITGIRRDDIGLSIIYRIDDDGDWRWLYTLNTANGLTLEQIVSNQESAASQIIARKHTSLFYADKTVGINHREYVAGPKDHSMGMAGSVMCRDISIGSRHSYVRAVLSVTTYGFQLCGTSDASAKAKLEQLVVPPFERRLQLELALLYIRDVLAARED